MKKTFRSAALSTIIMLVAAILTLTGVTYAWFAATTSVDASGMKVAAKVDSSLVITTAASTTSSNTTNITFTDDKTDLKPATRDTSDNSLKVLTSAVASKIDANTGLPVSGTDLAYTTAGTDSYIEKTVYISSASGAISDKKLKMTLSSAKAPGAGSELLATTVDFFNGSTYIGSANLSGTDGANTVTTAAAVTLGARGGSADYAVTMRIYIDGGLTVSGDATKTYVRTNNYVSTDEVSLAVNFALAD